MGNTLRIYVMTHIVMICCWALADVSEMRLREVEKICAYTPSDSLDDEELEPTPEEVKSRCGASDADIVNDLFEIVMRNGGVSTNQDACETREIAINWIGRYGASNDVERLLQIATNNCDSAQRAAVTACMTILGQSTNLLCFTRGVVTNAVMYSAHVKEGLYIHLYGMCNQHSDFYILDDTVRQAVAAFFLERAAVELDDTLFIDRCAYTLNPSYRHSQQRRDNLAALRPPGLTGRRAELYDAAQHDAAQSE